MRLCFAFALFLICFLITGGAVAVATENTKAAQPISALTADDLLLFSSPTSSHGAGSATSKTGEPESAGVNSAEAGVSGAAPAHPNAAGMKTSAAAIGMEPELSTAPDERFYLQYAQATDGEFGIPRQRHFAGVEDAHVAQLVFNRRFFMDAKGRKVTREGDEDSLQPGTANPDLWLVVQHYPQNVGHPAADAFLQQYALRRFMEVLPVKPESIPTLHPEEWLAAQQSPKPGAGGGAETLLWESFAATRRHLLNGGKPPVKPGQQFSFPYHSVTTYVLTRPSEHYLTVIFTNEGYWGGAHNTWTSTAFTFDLRTGLLLQPSDIFTGSLAQRAVLKERLGELAVRAGVEGETALYSPRNNLLRTQRLALTPRGLVFIYNPGEIASHGDGSILLTVPVYDLEGYGVSTRFWE